MLQTGLIFKHAVFMWMAPVRNTWRLEARRVIENQS